MSDVSKIVCDRNKLLSHQISYLIQSLERSETDHLETIELDAGDVLIEQDDTDDRIYLVCSGELGVRRRTRDGKVHLVGEIGMHSVVGELALMGGQKRSTTVYALSHARLISVGREQLERLFADNMSAFEAFNEMAASRWQNLHLIGILGEIFGDLDFGTWNDLQQHFEWQPLSSGEKLFDQGDASDGMYIVVNGRLGVQITDEHGDIAVRAEIGPSEIVGEYALLTNEPRSASVFAIRESNVVKLSPQHFEELVETYPELMRRIALLLIKRQQKNNKNTGGEPPVRMSYTLVPNRPGLDLTAFADDLARSLSPYGDTLVLDAERFDQQFGGTHASASDTDATIQPLIVAKLDELEAEYRYLIFIADDEHNAWTRRAIGQADRLLIAARADDDPTISAFEQEIIDTSHVIRTELVLMHKAGTQMPSGTSAWLEHRSIHNHYHVRDGDRAHIDRMARRMSGHAIALVMGGGAAKGYAQMGFYKAMLETGIPYDYVGGASMGAIMGGQIAMECSYEEYERKAQWTADVGVIDRTLPMVAIAASRNVHKINEESCHDLHIEDLWCPFFCVSTSLSTASVRVHTRGIMWRAIRASMSIPGVFVPVVEDGDVLVDGGIMDNLPVTVMQDLSESQRIIAVDVVPYRERRRYYNIDTSVSGWRILLNKLNPFSRKIKAPSLIEVLMRTLEVNGTRASRNHADRADLLIQPDTRGFKPHEYDKWKHLAQRGYDASIEQLREWKSRQVL